MGAQVFIAAKPWFLKRGLDGAGVRADVWRATRAQHTIISAQESTAPTTVAGPWPGEPGAVVTAAGGGGGGGGGGGSPRKAFAASILSCWLASQAKTGSRSAISRAVKRLV